MEKFNKWPGRMLCILVITALILSSAGAESISARAETRITVKPLAGLTFRQAAEVITGPAAGLSGELPGGTAGSSANPVTGPSIEPSVEPSTGPSIKPTASPAGPSAEPTAEPTIKPTSKPTIKPTAKPTIKPTAKPTAKPTIKPPPRPTHKPTPKPTREPEKDKTPFKISVKKAGREKLSISWSKRKSADKYKVWQKKQNGKKWRVIKKTKKTKYKTEIKTGRYYKYKVTAIYGKKRVIAKTEVITACIPDNPYNITYKRIASHKASISWKRGSCTKHFIVYRKVDNGKFKKVSDVKKAGYIGTGLATERRYVYKIVPVYDNQKVKIYGGNTYIKIILKDEINTKIQNYSYKELCSDISSLKKLYGNHFHYNVIGQSTDGRNIYDLVIGNQYASQSILVVAQLHAREYMTSQLCMKQIEYYLQNYNDKINGVQVSDVLDKIAIHYIPMANPDGAAISQFGCSAIRDATIKKKFLKLPGSENPSLWKANARGVDLNKNYPYNYTARQGRRGSEGYTGIKKCSEPETQAIVNLVNSLKSSTTVRGQINYHATGSIVFGDYEGPLKKTITEMYNLACGITGYTSAAGYSGSGVGNLREFIMYKKNIPSITLEIGKSPCPLPKSEFADIWQRNKMLVLKEAQMLAK